MSDDKKYESQEIKIRKGQALNLAVADAISLGRQKDVMYIYERFLFYYEVAAKLQSSDIELIQEVLNTKGA